MNFRRCSKKFPVYLLQHLTPFSLLGRTNFGFRSRGNEISKLHVNLFTSAYMYLYVFVYMQTHRRECSQNEFAADQLFMWIRVCA